MKTIIITEINLDKISPATSGKLAIARAGTINRQLENIDNFIMLRVGDSVTIDRIRQGGHAKIYNLGIYACPRKDAPPLRAGIMIDRKGRVYVDINYHTTQ